MILYSVLHPLSVRSEVQGHHPPLALAAARRVPVPRAHAGQREPQRRVDAAPARAARVRDRGAAVHPQSRRALLPRGGRENIVTC